MLDHFNHELNELRGGVQTKSGEKRQIRIVLLAGADLIGTFSTPGLWSPEDMDHILGQFGAMIVERHGTDIDEALKHLRKWEDNIWIIRQVRLFPTAVGRELTSGQHIQNDVSSTKIRGFVNKGLSINYLIRRCTSALIHFLMLISEQLLRSSNTCGDMASIARRPPLLGRFPNSVAHPAKSQYKTQAPRTCIYRRQHLSQRSILSRADGTALQGLSGVRGGWRHFNTGIWRPLVPGRSSQQGVRNVNEKRCHA